MGKENGSVFAKLRREAKEKSKKNKDTRAEGMTNAEQMVKREVVETPAVSEEELNSLLAAATQDVVKAVVLNEEHKTSQVEVKKETRKLFQAQGLYYDSEKKKFIKVAIEYDPKSDYCKVLEHLEYSDSSAVAIYKINNLFSMKLIRDQDIT